jgi:hypothetical protein
MINPLDVKENDERALNFAALQMAAPVPEIMKTPLLCRLSIWRIF